MCRLLIAICCVLVASNSWGQVIQKSVGSPFSMFANQDFSAWIQSGNGNWQSLGNQVLMNQGNGWLVSKLPLTNFEIEAEYWLGEHTQAILFIRCTNPRFISSETAYQINLSDRGNQNEGAGGIVGIAQGSSELTRNRWNALKVTTNGSYLSIWLNNQPVVSNLYDTRFIGGLIALSVAKGEFRIKSFNVTIPGRW